MLRPLFSQQYGRSKRMSKALRLALQWWQEVLLLGFAELRVWQPPISKHVQLYADARGSPPRCVQHSAAFRAVLRGHVMRRLAAVLVCDGRIEYTDLEPAESILQFFRARRDNQIMYESCCCILLLARACVGLAAPGPLSC